MTSQRRIRARNHGLDKVRRVTMRVAGGGLVLSGGIAAVASATYAGGAHHRAVVVRTGANVAPPNMTANSVSSLTDPTLPPTTLAPSSPGSAVTAPNTTAPTVAPLQTPQSTPQTQPQYTPPVVVSGGS